MSITEDRIGERLHSNQEHSVDRHPDRATRSEEYVYLGFALWVLIGLCLDGWAHLNQPELAVSYTHLTLPTKA